MQNKMLLILKYLWDNTDEEHTASIADLMQYLVENNSSTNRKTVSKYIDTLIDFGIDIIKIRKTQNQYFIGTRHFEAPEVKLLIDAVQSSRFITKQKSKELINKLAVFTAPNRTDVLKRHLYVDSRNKTNNEEIYIISDKIQTAVIEKKKVCFQYFDYGVDGKKAVRHNGEQYIVSPFDLIWSNDTYYLAGLHETKGIVAKFRVDRMKGLEITDENALPKPKGYSVAKFFSQEFSMLGGEPCEVTLLCENELMNSIVDRFGRKVKTAIVDDEHFTVTVPVDLSGIFYGWVFASCGKMKILSPAQAVDGFNEIVERYSSGNTQRQIIQKQG
ncbi:MAG: WYL domain-containing protein [Clostridia bacterium]|nr:WYL domain-containing protein [Clostridia bacterium]